MNYSVTSRILFVTSGLMEYCVDKKIMDDINKG